MGEGIKLHIILLRAAKISSFFKVGHKKAFPREWEGEGGMFSVFIVKS